LRFWDNPLSFKPIFSLDYYLYLPLLAFFLSAFRTLCTIARGVLPSHYRDISASLFIVSVIVPALLLFFITLTYLALALPPGYDIRLPCCCRRRRRLHLPFAARPSKVQNEEPRI
jgi:hypothetical protein